MLCAHTQGNSPGTPSCAALSPHIRAISQCAGGNPRTPHVCACAIVSCASLCIPLCSLWVRTCCVLLAGRTAAGGASPQPSFTPSGSGRGVGIAWWKQPLSDGGGGVLHILLPLLRLVRPGPPQSAHQNGCCRPSGRVSLYGHVLHTVSCAGIQAMVGGAAPGGGQRCVGHTNEECLPIYCCLSARQRLMCVVCLVWRVSWSGSPLKEGRGAQLAASR